MGKALFKQLKALGAVLAMGVLSLTAPSPAEAATVSGQVEIAGIIDVTASDFSETGSVSFTFPGFALFGTGDFASDAGTFVSLFGFDFDAAGEQTILTLASGISFVAQSFSDIQDDAIKSFTATGFLSGGAFEDTFASLNFATSGSSNAVTSFVSSVAPVPVPASGILLVGALAGFGLMKRRRKAQQN